MNATPMLAQAQHPRTRNVIDPHRTPTQIRRSNRRQEQREVRQIADEYRNAAR